MSQRAKSCDFDLQRTELRLERPDLQEARKAALEHAVIALRALRIVALDIDDMPPPDHACLVGAGGHARGASAATASTTVIAGCLVGTVRDSSKAGAFEQAGVFLDGALAPAAQHHHLQVEPAAGTGAVVGRQRRLQHQHARVRLHRAADVAENAQAFVVVVVVQQVADQISVAAFRRGLEHVAGDEGDAGQRPALAALRGRDRFRHVEQRRTAVGISGEDRGNQRTVAAADVDDVLERREVVGGDDRRRLRPVHLEHHPVEALGLIGMRAEPVEERLALERLETRDVAGKRIVEVHPHVGEVVVEIGRRGRHRVGRARAEQAAERREHEAAAGGLADDADGRERAQQPVDPVRDETARGRDRRMILRALFHRIGKSKARERAHSPRDPQAAQELQHLLVQQRRVCRRRILGTLAVHVSVPL